MDDPKHTSGPWAAWNGGDNVASDPFGAWHLVGPTRVYQDRTLGFAAADAYLMAAAPDMHDAIDQALDDMRDGHCVCEATKQMLKDALSRARR